MYRAYWAIPRTLRTRSGEQTNTVFGMASMLLAILQHEEPDALLLCFDAGEETFRHKEHGAYKEGRAETPDDFYAQIPRVMELVDAFSFRHVSDLQYEADDFLCTYARAGVEAGMRVTIVSGDRDLLQLASDRVRIAIPHKGYQQAEYLGPSEIEGKYGIRPEQVASYKGLTGDTSDNLPGVHGIGPKTAAELLQKYGSLAGVYEHLAEIRASVREKLEHDREQAFFCERMAELVCDIPLPVALKELEVRGLPAEPLLRFFEAMEFTLLLKRFRTFLATDYGSKSFAAPAMLAGTASSSAARGSDEQLGLFS
jgi:DNA polymerase-1